MNKNQLIISASIGISLLLCTAIIIYFRKHITQSINGIMNKSYFTIKELCASNVAQKKGIDNTPDKHVKANLQNLIDNVLNPARQQYGSYILVNSGYRCQELNNAVGGAKNSQHLTGKAADITADSINKNRKLFEILVTQGNFDQLIWEKPKDTLWIHVSYNPGENRGQILAYNGKEYTDIRNNWQTAIA